MKHQSPMVGYNNNIPHKGRMYHVQTEDSGAKRPHIITHLFADGGTIINTNKTSYTELLGGEDVNEKVRQLMKAQHKAMVISLRDGAFDEVIVSLLGSVAPGELGDAPLESPLPAEPSLDPETLEAPTPLPRSGSKPPSEETSYRFIGGRSEVAGESTAPSSRGRRGTGRRRRPTGSHQVQADDQKRTRAISRPGTGGRPLRFGEEHLSTRPLDQVALEFLTARGTF